MFLAGTALAQNLPRLSVRVSETKVLEGQSTTLTFRLNSVTADRLEYCFMAGGSVSDSLIWEFDSARPVDSGYTQVTRYIEAGQREDVVTIRTRDDGVDDIGEQQILFRYSIADDHGALTCTQNYTINNNRKGGALSVYDLHDFYSSVDVTVAANQTSISEGAAAEFTLTRSGGLISQGALVFAADELDMDVKFSISQTGYVFPGDFAPWRVKGDAGYQELSTDPADGHLLFGVQQSISEGPVDLTLRLSTSGDFFGATPSVELGVYRSATQPFLQAVSVTPSVLPSGELEFTMPFEEYDANNAIRMVRVALVSDDLDEADGSATLTIPAQQGAASVSSTVTVQDNDGRRSPQA